MKNSIFVFLAAIFLTQSVHAMGQGVRYLLGQEVSFMMRRTPFHAPMVASRVGRQAKISTPRFSRFFHASAFRSLDQYTSELIEKTVSTDPGKLCPKIRGCLKGLNVQPVTDRFLEIEDKLSKLRNSKFPDIVKLCTMEEHDKLSREREKLLVFLGRFNKAKIEIERSQQELRELMGHHNCSDPSLD